MGKTNNKMKKRFPTLAVILLAVSVVWLLNELEILNISIPWLPIILIVISIGMVINRIIG